MEYVLTLVLQLSCLVDAKKPLLGDALVIAGTFCYAFSNVGEVSEALYNVF